MTTRRGAIGSILATLAAAMFPRASSAEVSLMPTMVGLYGLLEKPAA